MDFLMIYPSLRTWITLNKKTFDRNIDSYKEIIEPYQAKIAIVIKSNAYGHGINEIAQLGENNKKIDYFCVAMLSEAIALRLQGIKKPIVVLGIIDTDPELAIAHDIDLTVYNLEIAKTLSDHAVKLKKPCFIHLKVDTGLSRFGFMPDEIIANIQVIQQLPNMIIKGIYSHFAESNNEDLTVTNKQLLRFKNVLENLKSNGIDIPLRHIANSAGISCIDLSDLSMVRLGAGTYGMNPSNISINRSLCKNEHFYTESIIRWHTRIMHIRTIPAGQSIGYDCTYTTTKETRIGLLPIGYADGYSKRLSNKGSVLLQQHQAFAPVIGRVAMNVTIIDISAIPHAQIGDEVILVGKEAEISPNRIAELTEGFNPREITVQINQQIPRIILDD
jgi:alanine racemase